jgi:hypothetical protein
LKRDLNGLQYDSDILEVIGRLKEWRKNSDNPDLLKFTDAMLRITFYVNSLQLEKYSFDRIISEMRSQRNDALIRIQKLEEKLEEYEPTSEIDQKFENELKEKTQKS